MAKKKITKKAVKNKKTIEETDYQRILIGDKVKEGEREKALKLIADDFKEEVFSTFEEKEEIVFLPTTLCSFNRCSILGGWPMGTIGEVKGPNQGGKTVFGVQMLRSFVEAGHMAMFVDAERAAQDKKWIGNGLGLRLDECIYYVPDSLEQAWKDINKAIIKFKKAKEADKIDKNLLFMIVVDSITNLVPEKFLKEGDAKDIGLQARLISQWMKTLSVLVGPKGNEKPSVSILFINQERRNIGAKPWESQWYSTCGEALQFYASVRIRVSHAGYVKDKDGTKIGKKHKIVVEKNKVGYPDSVGYFYTSNGKGDVPIGIDYYREVIDECKNAGLITGSGAWLNLPNGEKINGEKKLIKHLLKHPELLEELKQLHLQEVLNGNLNSVYDDSILDEFEE